MCSFILTDIVTVLKQPHSQQGSEIVTLFCSTLCANKLSLYTEKGNQGLAHVRSLPNPICLDDSSPKKKLIVLQKPLLQTADTIGVQAETGIKHTHTHAHNETYIFGAIQ